MSRSILGYFHGAGFVCRVAVDGGQCHQISTHGRGDCVAFPCAVVVGVRYIAAGLPAGIPIPNALFEATRAAQDQAATVTSVVEQTVTGIRVVKAFSQQQREVAHLHAEARSCIGAGCKLLGSLRCFSR